MKQLINFLYKLSRQSGRIASRMSDVKNILEGNGDRVIKKAIRREMHKNLNKTMKSINL